MCGICGLLGRDAPDPGLVERDERRDRTSRPRPRLPSPPTAAACSATGASRSSTCATGDQPVESERGDVVAVFNGELYNFRELRRELEAKGHEIRGTGDSPLIPHAYEEWGLDFAAAPRGDVRDRALGPRRASGSCSLRDRLGKKPLLYARLPDGSLAFASETKALLHAAGAAARARPRRSSTRSSRSSTCRARACARSRRCRRARTRWSRAARCGSSATGRRSRAATRRAASWIERVRDEVTRGRAAAARRRRAARRAALGRDRLVDRRRGDGAGLGGAGAHVHGRLPRPRATTSGRTRARSPSGTAPRTRSSRSTRSPELLERRRARPSTSRSATRRRCRRCSSARRRGATSRSRSSATAATRSSAATSATGRTRSPGACRASPPRAGAVALGAVPAARRRAALDALPRAALPRRRRARRPPSATRRLVEVFPLELRRRLWTDEALAHADGDAASRTTTTCGSSTSSRTSRATCCRRRTSPRWPSRSSCARRSSTTASSSSASRCRPSSPRGKAALKQAFAADLPPEIAGARQDRASASRSTAGSASELRPLAEDLLLGGADRGLFRRAELERLLARARRRARRPRAPPLVPLHARALAAHTTSTPAPRRRSSAACVRRGRAYATASRAACVLPRLARARSTSAARSSPPFVEKSDILARVFVDSGTFGYVAGRRRRRPRSRCTAGS